MAREEKIAHTGFHAEIFRGKLSSADGYLSKHYGKKSERGFEPVHAVKLIGHMRSFVDRANAIGVPIAVPMGYYIENNHVPGLVNLVEAVHVVGPDLREILTDPRTTEPQIRTYLHEYLSLFARVWKAGFTISLDPPPANFCLGKNGKLHFIDCMPPRQKISSGKLLSEMPDPPESSRQFIESRYFSVYQARVIYAQLLRSLSATTITPTQIKHLIRERLGKEAYSVVEISDQTKKQIRLNARPTDVDTLRIIAAEARYAGQLSKDDLAAVYKDAHIDTGGILPSQKQIDHAVSILKRAGVL